MSSSAKLATGLTFVSPTLGFKLKDHTRALENQGETSEDFMVTISANSTQIGEQFVTSLSANTTTILTFICDITGFEYGNYSITVSADIVLSARALMLIRMTKAPYARASRIRPHVRVNDVVFLLVCVKMPRPPEFRPEG